MARIGDHIASYNAGVEAGRRAGPLIRAGLPSDTALASAAIRSNTDGYDLSPWLHGYHVGLSEYVAVWPRAEPLVLLSPIPAAAPATEPVGEKVDIEA